MRRAKTPCKQLNSEAIKGATLCYMSPVIAGQCSIISAKCVWHVKERDLHKSWNSICKKRDSCDKAISAIPSTAFFFSAISTHEKKKGSIDEDSELEESQEEHELSPVPSTSSQRWLDGNPTRINKSLWPAITYWLALTTPNGAPANPLMVHRALLECGMGVTANQVQFQDGKECTAIKELYNLLKDHRNSYMQDILTASYQYNYQDEFSSLGGRSPLSSSELQDCQFASKIGHKADVFNISRIAQVKRMEWSVCLMSVTESIECFEIKWSCCLCSLLCVIFF